MLSDQQVTNIFRHLETCHRLSREAVNRSQLPQGEPPFPGMLAPFVHEMNVNEEAFLQKITVAMYVLTSNKMKNIGSVNNRYVCIMLPHYIQSAGGSSTSHRDGKAQETCETSPTEEQRST